MELTTALGGFATAASQFAQGDFLGGIASVVSSVGSIFSMGKKVKEMNREAREEQQKFYDEAIQGEMEYQRLLRERLRTQRQIGEMTLAYNKRIDPRRAIYQRRRLPPWHVVPEGEDVERVLQSRGQELRGYREALYRG